MEEVESKRELARGGKLVRWVGSMPEIESERMLLMIIVGLIMIGQMTLMQNAGVYADIKDLYQIGAFAMVAFCFWPQVKYVLAVGDKLLYGESEESG